MDSGVKEMEYDVLRRVIARYLLVDPNEITPETTFLSDLGADSLDLYQIINGVEEELGITAPLDDIVKITNVQEALDLILEAEQAK